MRQRTHDLDLVLGQELREVRIVREEQDGEIAPIHHVSPEHAHPLHEVSEPGVQFGRPARDVDGRNVGPFEDVDTPFHNRPRHDLHPVRTGIDVAMPARLVTLLADIDLKDLDRIGT
jgi:hypothetical protein